MRPEEKKMEHAGMRPEEETTEHAGMRPEEETTEHAGMRPEEETTKDISSILRYSVFPTRTSSTMAFIVRVA